MFPTPAYDIVEKRLINGAGPVSLEAIWNTA